MTTKQQHTPNYTDKRYEVHEGNDYVCILGPHDTTDAPSAYIHGDTTEETLCRARLFAAAPDLLAAHMDDDLAKEIASLLIGDTLVAFLEWRDTQCAAIAKARGE